MTAAGIVLPLPPREMREMVGSPDVEFFDNPSGELLYPQISPELYDAVFDFGCGCGRIARLLLQQREHKPRRYLGIDVHRGMIDWCVTHLTPVAPGFRFLHHDVWSPSYGRDNSPRLAEPFPADDGSFSLIIADSVFTHIYKEQAEYYLHEIARILTPGGVALTSWFFFDNDSFPFRRDGVPCLFTGEIDATDTTAAVIYDRRWFLAALRRSSLTVAGTTLPPIAGHQWWLRLERRRPGSVDQFPLGEDAAEWLCGATRRPMAKPAVPKEEVQRHKVGEATPPPDERTPSGRPPPPAPTGIFAELATARAELATARAELATARAELAATQEAAASAQRLLAEIKRSLSWQLVEKVAVPAHALRRALRAAGSRLRIRPEVPAREEFQDYSQHGEQPLILKYFAETSVPFRRYVVDIGAFDGCVGSNSYALILRGWDALLVEPVPEVFERLAKLHAHRPNVRAVRTAISNYTADAATMFRVTGPANTPEAEQWQYSQVSTLLHDVVTRHPTDLGWSYHPITVPVTTMGALLTQHAVPRDFGYLSIDCEGEDLNVLRSMDLRSYRPRLISVECEDNNRHLFADYLREFGYSYYASTRSNTFFQIDTSTR